MSGRLLIRRKISFNQGSIETEVEADLSSSATLSVGMIEKLFAKIVEGESDAMPSQTVVMLDENDIYFQK